MHDEELAGDDGGDGAEPFGDLMGESEAGMGIGKHGGIVADGDDFAFEVVDFFNHGLHEGEHFASGGDDKDGETVFYHGDWAMKKIGTGIGFGNGIGGFFELEGKLEGGAIVEATADGDAVFHIAISFGELGDLIFVSEDGFGGGGDFLNLLEEGVALGEIGAEEGDGGELGGVGFGGGDGGFGAGVNVDDVMTDIGHVGIGFVGDAGGEGALFFGFGEHTDDVGAFAALGDAEHECGVIILDSLINGGETGGGQGDNQSVVCAKHIFGIAAGVVGCASGGDEDIFDVFGLDVLSECFDGGVVGVDEGVEDVWLLVNLLIHDRVFGVHLGPL